MNNFLSDHDKELLSFYVRPETLEPCFKQIGKKDARPHYNRPTYVEVRSLAKLIGLEGSALGLLVGKDARLVRRWQSVNGIAPDYSDWTLLCIYAAKTLSISKTVCTN